MFVLAYARLYGRALLDALAAIGRNVWTLVLPMGLVVAFLLMLPLVAPLGFVGGIVLALAQSAGASIYTYFVAQVVAKNRVSLAELRTSIGAYFWTWINLFFVLWIVDLVLGPMALTAEGRSMRQALTLLELIALNAAPEVIYVKGTSGGLETIQRSFGFLQENWIEWFIPNGLILAVLWLMKTGTIPVFALPFWVLAVLAGALLHVVMVYRGFLFQSLDSTSHRQRLFRFGGKR